MLKQWSKSHKLTVPQLLETLQDATCAEQYILRVDYFSLHQRCLRIVRTLRITLNEKFRQYFGVGIHIACVNIGPVPPLVYMSLASPAVQKCSRSHVLTFGPDWIENETRLVFIVPYIFNAAAGSGN